MKKISILLSSLIISCSLCASVLDKARVPELLQEINLLACNGDTCFSQEQRTQLFDYVKQLVSLDPESLLLGVDVARALGFTNAVVQQQLISMKGR